jgi:hypothetical protein
VPRFGGYRNPAAKKKAVVALAHTLIVIIWNVSPATVPTSIPALSSTTAITIPDEKPST